MNEENKTSENTPETTAPVSENETSSTGVQQEAPATQSEPEKNEPVNDAPAQEEPKSEPIPKATPEGIAERLSNQETQTQQQQDNVVQPQQAPTFDVSKLTKEQIQTLQSILNATPEAADRKEDRKPTIALRKVDEKIIVDFKNTFKKLVDDPENRRQVLQLTIPVRFRDTDVFVDMIYNEFINSERVNCEIIDIKRTPDQKVVGSTISRETGRPVDMVVKFEHTTYTVKLPSGEELTVDSRIANA